MKLTRHTLAFIVVTMAATYSANIIAETVHGSRTTKFGRTFSGGATVDGEAGSASATGSAGGKWGKTGIHGSATGTKGEGGQASISSVRGYGASGNIKKAEDGTVQAGLNTNGGGSGSMSGGATESGYASGGSWTTRNGKTASSSTSVDTSEGTVNRNTLSGKETSRSYDTEQAASTKISAQSRFQGRFGK